MKVRVRYAPSPTGKLHIGGARTALFNYLFAKKHQGKFILRIEDTDNKRNVIGGEKSQINNLNWLGVVLDESPQNPNLKYGKYRQSERNEIYKKYAQKLIDEGDAYYCYCSKEELERARKNSLIENKLPRYSGKCLQIDKSKAISLAKPVIRLKVPKKQKFEWNDLVRGKIIIHGEDFGDWVIMKNDGTPTYNFSTTIDDHLMEITHIFRGEEHISNTPKQIHLYQLLGWTPPYFGHVTLIVDQSGKKLSKRNQSIIQFVSQYKSLGYLPQALVNFLAFLGWSPKTEQDIYSPQQLIEIFDEKGFSKSSAFFDQKKLDWINSTYIKKLTSKKYLKLVIPFAQKAYPKVNFMKPTNQEILQLYQKEIKYGQEITSKISLFFQNQLSYSFKVKSYLDQKSSQEVINVFAREIKEINWSLTNVQKAIDKVKKITNKKGKNLYMPLRAYTTGQMHGPSLDKTIYLLGQEKIASLMYFIEKEKQ